MIDSADDIGLERATLQVAGGYVLPIGSTLRFSNETGIIVQGPASSVVDVLTIAGTLQVSYDLTAFHRAVGLSALNIYPGNATEVVTIERSGTLDVRSTSAGSMGAAVGFVGEDSYSPDLINLGSIQVTASGRAQGVLGSSQGGWFFDNRGTVTVTSLEGSAFGTEFSSSGDISNSGTILATGAVGAQGVSISSFASVRLTNSGTIVAKDLSGGGGSTGVAWLVRSTPLNFPPSNVFVNSGWVEGDYALRVLSDFPNPRASPAFENTGTLVGKVDLGAEAMRFVNSGRIQGEVLLGSGNDTYAGAQGLTVGLVSGGDGDDSLVGGAGFDNFQGNVGNDTASGGLGHDWVVGGKDNDLLSGDAGNDLVYGNLGADTCEGGEGNDIVRGGQDNDSLSGGSGDDYVSGDKGDDTVAGGAGADIFHTFGDAGIDRVLDFNLAQGDRVQVDPGTQYTVAQVGADTVVSMTGGGQMVLVGVSMGSLTPGWIFGA